MKATFEQLNMAKLKRKISGKSVNNN